jgi:hypothetical protein
MTDWLNKVPRYLKREKNPFAVLEEKIQVLETELKKLISSKDEMQSQETQFKYEVETKEFSSQTDSNSPDFNSIHQQGPSKLKELVEKSIQVSIIEIPRASLAPTVDSGKENLKNTRFSSEDHVRPSHLRQQSADSIHREEEPMTPVHLRSIYKHSEDFEESKLEAMRLPSLSKKLGPIRPPTVPSILTSDIKRHIRQANSRRKNETLF